METLVLDLKQALRRLAGAPGFTLMVLLIAGLGIGSSARPLRVVFGAPPMPWADVIGTRVTLIPGCALLES